MADTNNGETSFIDSMLEPEMTALRQKMIYVNPDGLKGQRIITRMKELAEQRNTGRRIEEEGFVSVRNGNGSK